MLFAKIALAGLLLFTLFQYNLIEASLLINILHHIDLFIFALLCLFLGILIGGLRWKLLISASGINIKWTTILQLYLIGSFFSSYLPGAAGGDAIRALYLYRMLDSGRSLALLTLFADRLFSLFGLLSAATIIYIIFPTIVAHEALLINYGKLTSLLLFGVIFFTAICYIFAAFIQKRGWDKLLPAQASKYIQPVLSVMLLYRKSWITILCCWLLSIIASGIVAFGIILIAKIFPFAPNLLVNAIAGIYANLSSIIPITPGGIGVGETVFAKICTDLLATAAPFATIYFVFRLAMLLANLPGMFTYLFFSVSSHV